MPYIDANKLIAHFQGEWDWHMCQCVKQFAEDGEFEPVIHAHWIHATTFSKCSHCGYYTSKHQWETKRCPECGAHMDEV